jgi:protocatechuate 3,4-dioxygenase beta subunit
LARIEPHIDGPTEVVTRRRVLGLLGAGATLVVAACRPRPRPGGTTTTLAPGACALTPEQTEGPFYAPRALNRSDITEGHPGAPLALTIKVENRACAPLPGAVVDIWHCDAAGVYSSSTLAPGTTNTTFCRGVQAADDTGTAGFQTIYPGWYAGRAIHIHVKVHVPAQAADRVVHTGQLYFDDALNDQVMAKAPYNRAGVAGRIRNNSDGIYRNGGAATLVAVTPDGDGYRGEITLAVNV